MYKYWRVVLVEGAAGDVCVDVARVTLVLQGNLQGTRWCLARDILLSVVGLLGLFALLAVQIDVRGGGTPGVLPVGAVVLHTIATFLDELSK